MVTENSLVGMSLSFFFNYEANVLYLRQNAKMPQYYCCANKISPIAASYWKSPDSLFHRNRNLKIPTDIHLWVNHLRKN